MKRGTIDFFARKSRKLQEMGICCQNVSWAFNRFVLCLLFRTWACLLWSKDFSFLLHLLKRFHIDSKLEMI